MKCFALVYADYEGLNLLALGDKEFIKSEYERIKNEVQEFLQKYNFKNVKSYELPNEFYMNKYCSMTDLDRLCIQGYKNGEIQCVCEEFETQPKEKIYY